MGSHSAMQHQNQHPDVSVFIKNLNEITDGKTLSEIFAEFGTIVSCKLAYDEKGKSKGYAFVQYENEAAARAAIEKVNGMLLDDKSIYVGKFIPRKGRNKERDERNIYTNLYVKNFGNDFTEEQLRQLFEPFGKIKSHKIMTDIEGHSKGFGFVAFEKAEFAEEALQKLNGKELNNGHKLYVARAQKKAERQQELQRQFEEQEERKRRENSHGLNLYVKNLDDSVTDAHLRREFSLYGPLTSARVMTDSSGRSKGFGFVRFVSPVDACFAAAGLNGRMFGSKPLYVSLAQRKEERRALLVAQHMRQRLQATESLYAVSKSSVYRRPSANASQNRMRAPASSPHSSSSQVGISTSSSHWATTSSPQRNANLHSNTNGHDTPAKNVWRSSSLARQVQMPRTGPVVKSQCNMRYVPTVQQRASTPSCNGSLKSPTPSQLITMPSSPPSTPQPPAKVRSIPSVGMLSVKQFNSFMSRPSSPPTESLTARSSPANAGNVGAIGNELTEEKQVIGERLFFVVQKIYPQLAGKITGMILEMDTAELWYLLGDNEALRDKIEEAYQVYKAYLNDMREGTSSSMDTD